MTPSKVFSDTKLKAYETIITKKVATPLSSKKKKEDD